MKLLDYAHALSPRPYHYDFVVYGLLAIISPVSPEIPMGDHFQWTNIHLLYIGDIGVGKSTVIERLAYVTPKKVYMDKVTEGSIIGLYGSRDIVFPIIEGAYEGVIYSTEFDKTVKNKRVQGLLRRILERWEIQTWTRGYTRKIVPNSALVSAANPRGDVLRATKLFDVLVFELGLLNRFDYIKLQSLRKEDIYKLADELGLNAWTVQGKKVSKIEEIRQYISKLYETLRQNKDTIRVRVPQKYPQELVKLYKEKADPERNPLENIRLLISSFKILQLSTIFNMDERIVKNNIVEASEEDLELAKMFLTLQVENLRKIYEYMENTRESKSAKILAIYSIIKRLVSETKGPVKLSEVIRESEKEGIASENTVRRYVRILADQGHVKLWLYKTVYYVGLRNTMSPEEFFEKKQVTKTS